jgi:hypothetical protein
MVMATRSGPAAGDLSIAEIKEFAGFPAATQRYIRRSLDIGLDRDDAIARWSRDRVEEAAIRVQARVYRRLDDIRAHIPDDSGLDALELFMAPLVAVSAFDLGQDRLPAFAPYRFLYERLLGAHARPWLPGAFCAAASAPRQAPGPAPVDQRGRRHRAGMVGARTQLLSRMGRQDRRDAGGELMGPDPS